MDHSKFFKSKQHYKMEKGGGGVEDEKDHRTIVFLKSGCCCQ
jgi:hypothetical protein